MHATRSNQLEAESEECRVEERRLICVCTSHLWCRRDEGDEKFGAIPFGEVIARTPDDLKQRPNGIYVSIAIPWCIEPLQQVSRRLLLHQLEPANNKHSGKSPNFLRRLGSSRAYSMSRPQWGAAAVVPHTTATASPKSDGIICPQSSTVSEGEPLPDEPQPT